ncbi:hypothetical protein WJX84_000790 [Apatococcus fuscideae]|uniref:Uncharacterized protein n=1 Tax=Apatococcus fuscideae TaxID=2026836 RepID=A0AAW1SPL0_9CHLO
MAESTARCDLAKRKLAEASAILTSRRSQSDTQQRIAQSLARLSSHFQTGSPGLGSDLRNETQDSVPDEDLFRRLQAQRISLSLLSRGLSVPAALLQQVASAQQPPTAAPQEVAANALADHSRFSKNGILSDCQLLGEIFSTDWSFLEVQPSQQPPGEIQEELSYQHTSQRPHGEAGEQQQQAGLTASTAEAPSSNAAAEPDAPAAAAHPRSQSTDDTMPLATLFRQNGAAEEPTAVEPSAGLDEQDRSFDDSLPAPSQPLGPTASQQPQDPPSGCATHLLEPLEQAHGNATLDGHINAARRPAELLACREDGESASLSAALNGPAVPPELCGRFVGSRPSTPHQQMPRSMDKARAEEQLSLLPPNVSPTPPEPLATASGGPGGRHSGASNDAFHASVAPGNNPALRRPLAGTSSSHLDTPGMGKPAGDAGRASEPGSQPLMPFIPKGRGLAGVGQQSQMGHQQQHEMRLAHCLQRRQAELTDLPPTTPNDTRMACLLESKRLSLAGLQRNLRSSIIQERQALHNVASDRLMDWRQWRRPGPPHWGAADKPAAAAEFALPAAKRARISYQPVSAENKAFRDDAIRMREAEQQEREELKAKLAQAKRLQAFRMWRAAEEQRKFLADLMLWAREGLRPAAQQAQRRRAQRNQGVRTWHSK